MDSKKLIFCIVVGNLITVLIVAVLGTVGFNAYKAWEENRAREQIQRERDLHDNYLKAMMEEIKQLQKKEKEGDITPEEKVRLRYLEKQLREGNY